MLISCIWSFRLNTSLLCLTDFYSKSPDFLRPLSTQIQTVHMPPQTGPAFFCGTSVYTAYPLSHWQHWEPQQMVPSDTTLTGFLHSPIPLFFVQTTDKEGCCNDLLISEVENWQNANCFCSPPPPAPRELLNLLTTKQHRQRVLIIVQTIQSVGLAFQTQAVLVNLKIVTTFKSYASYSNQPTTTKEENMRQSPLLLKIHPHWFRKWL